MYFVLFVIVYFCGSVFFKDAVSKYQEVTNNLEFAKELQRSFMALSQDVSKEQVVQCGLSAAIPNSWALNSLSLILDAVVSPIYRDEILVISCMFGCFPFSVC